MRLYEKPVHSSVSTNILENNAVKLQKEAAFSSLKHKHLKRFYSANVSLTPGQPETNSISVFIVANIKSPLLTTLNLLPIWSKLQSNKNLARKLKIYFSISATCPRATCYCSLGWFCIRQADALIWISLFFFLFICVPIFKRNVVKWLKPFFPIEILECGFGILVI